MSGQQGGESPSGTTIRDYTDLPIIDQFGNSWALSRSAQVMVDGQIDRTTNGVTELAYINRQIWQWVASKRLWWSKSSPLAPWLPPAGTTDAPFGPTPDPRLDQILTAVSSLAAADAAAFGGVAGQIEAIQGAIDAIPPPPDPDPRIAALIGAVQRGFAHVNAGLANLSDKMDAENALLADWWTTLLSRLDTMDAAHQANAEAITALSGQADRIIKLLLDLFPDQPKKRIVIDTANVHFTSQPAPAAPGP